MPLTKATVEAVLALSMAVLQRHEQINQLCTGLRGGTVYRSPDGKIAIDITEAQLKEAEAAIRQLISDADAASAGILALIPEP